MEAKDTILKSSLNADGSVHYPTMEEQAEITWDIAFKAGYEKTALEKQKVKEILKIIWQDASKWGASFGDTAAVDKWLDKKTDEICQLDNTKPHS